MGGVLGWVEGASEVGVDWAEVVAVTGAAIEMGGGLSWGECVEGGAAWWVVMGAGEGWAGVGRIAGQRQALGDLRCTKYTVLEG